MNESLTPGQPALDALAQARRIMADIELREDFARAEARRQGMVAQKSGVRDERHPTFERWKVIDDSNTPLTNGWTLTLEELEDFLSKGKAIESAILSAPLPGEDR